jgi:hypothetical protein
MVERFHRAIQRRDDEVQRPERLLLESLELFLEVKAA